MLLNQRKRTINRFVPSISYNPSHDGLSRVTKPTRSMSLQANTPVEHSCTRNFSNRRQHQHCRASSLLTAKSTAVYVSLMRTALQGMSWLSPAPSVRLHKERNEPKQKLPHGQHRRRRDSVQPDSEDNDDNQKGAVHMEQALEQVEHGEIQEHEKEEPGEVPEEPQLLNEEEGEEEEESVDEEEPREEEQEEDIEDCEHLRLLMQLNSLNLLDSSEGEEAGGKIETERQSEKDKVQTIEEEDSAEEKEATDTNLHNYNGAYRHL